MKGKTISLSSSSGSHSLKVARAKLRCKALGSDALEFLHTHNFGYN